VLVVEMGKTRTDAFSHAVASLAQVRARIFGVVLNKVTARPGSHYYHGYYHPYLTDDSGRGRRRRKKQRQFSSGRWIQGLFRTDQERARQP
jgi:Mrp family chromosome partitioning ATPase